MKKLLVVIVLLFVLCISFSCKNKKHEYNKVYKEDGIQYIDYGKFPQTHVSNSKTIKELDKITDTNSSGYYEYNGNDTPEETHECLSDFINECIINWTLEDYNYDGSKKSK